MDTTTKTLTDGELSARLSPLRKKHTAAWVLLAISAIMILIGFLSSGVLPVILGFALLVGGIIFRTIVNANIKELLSDNLMPPVLAEIFDSARHDPTQRMPDHIVCGIELGIPSFNEISGSDYIEGVYKGLNVQMSDLELVRRERHRVRVNGKWETKETRTTVFKGQWLVCDFGKELVADLLLCEKGFISLTKSTVETENIAFNKKFSIHSADGHSVFYILTPHMMEYILSMDDKGGGTTRMRFTREGKVHIAIHNNKDRLRISSRDFDDLDKIRQKFRNDIRYLTDLIDELRLVDTMYRK